MASRLYGFDPTYLNQQHLQDRMLGDETTPRDEGGDVNQPMLGMAPGPTPDPNSPIGTFLTKTAGQTPEQRIAQSYPAFLGGRQPGPGEPELHYGNQNGLTGALSEVYGSTEGQTYRSAHPNVNGPVTRGPTQDLSNPPVAAPNPATTGTTTGGTTGGTTGTRVISGGSIGNVQGYDANKFADPSVQSLKYRAGRILSDYPTTEAGLRQALQDPRWLADPDLAKASYSGGDKINFNGVLSDGTTGVPVNWVDVLQAFENGASEHPWQWGDQNFVGAGGGGGTGGTTGGYGTDPLAGSVGSSLLDQIMAELQSVIRGKPSPTDQSTLQQLLGGGGGG